MPVVGSMRNAPRVGADFKLVDLDDEEENVQPLPVPTDREVDGRCREDVMRGYITCGLLQKLLHQLQQAQDPGEERQHQAGNREDTYQGERELLQMDHDFKTSCQLTAFLEARIEAEKTKKERLLVLLEADENENESEA
ncbi:hypothetical protein M3Y99_01865200 [Aphelenchoides fujianensis]|nr:hypothetical protein M3Y99_01865200 [Aphelenchoides fujianensis]